ncbi:MAG: hypothetical protein O3A85_14375 [Proteobacteria bacterium]|nr:hypothetical protein [Pseudomonadota bacterium]
MTKTSDALAIQSVIDGLDHVASELENKWGVGRLRLLVDNHLRQLFDQQAALFNEAVFANDLKSIREHGEGMRRGWVALDQAADQSGAKPLDPDIWEVNGPDGVIVLVRTNPEAHAVVREGRAAEVWTLDEVAKIIGNLRRTVGEAKRVFPGAQVVDAVDRFGRGDELPPNLD